MVSAGGIAGSNSGTISESFSTSPFKLNSFPPDGGGIALNNSGKIGNNVFWNSQTTTAAQGVINGTFTVPGDGVIDFDSVLTLLHDGGYEGWLVVEAEQDPAVAPSYAYAKKGYETLRTIVDRLAAKDAR